MDWCIDTRVPGAVSAAEADIAAHLARHAVDPIVAELAGPIVHEALAFPSPGPAWVAVDWADATAQLSVRRLPVGDLPGAPVTTGVTRAHHDMARLADIADQHGQPRVELDLGVGRPAEGDVDPEPVDLPDAATPAGAVAALLARDASSGSSLTAAAARAGASLAAQRDVSGHDAAAVAAAFIAAEDALGGDFHLVQVSPTRALLTNRRCPFGPDVTPAMCRVTSALAGGLAARTAGAAEITLDERLSLGDHQCRLHIDLAPTGPRVTSHHYTWPPAGVSGGDDDEGTPATPGFRVTLSLHLPRDRLSVPVTRHLIRAAMDEVGVLADDADAVELAVTEARANVIDHAGPGDSYDIVVTVGPSTCHIRVIDVGRSFDHTTFAPRIADDDAEHGRDLSLMHALVDHVRFDSEPDRSTIVHLVKALHFDDTVPARRLMLTAQPTEQQPDRPGS